MRIQGCSAHSKSHINVGFYHFISLVICYPFSLILPKVFPQIKHIEMLTVTVGTMEGAALHRGGRWL